MAFVEMKKRKREEYEMQLFGFHSRAVNATLMSLIQEKIQSKCEKLILSVENKYKPQGDDIQKLRENKKKLMKSYYLGYKSQLPAIKNSINKLITIPDNVLLNEDKIQSDQYTIGDLNKMKSELEELQQRLKRAMILNAVLNEENEIAEQIDKNINAAVTSCDIIEDGIKHPVINNTMIKLIESYRELRDNVEKSNETSTANNKKRCLKFIPKPYNSDYQ